MAIIATLCALVTPAASGDLVLPDGRPLSLAAIVMVDTEPAARWLGDGPVELPADPAYDRRGRLHVLPSRGAVSLQSTLLRAGQAILAPEPGVADAVLASLLTDEAAARAERRGVWAQGRAGPFPADRVRAAEGSYVVIEGTVLEVAWARAFVYANFGEDRRTDATLRIAAADAGRWAKGGFEPRSLVGRNVRARGVLVQLDGPMLEITHPAQIEVTDR